MKLNKIAALIAIAGLSTSAFATNGYFSHGYGMKAKGMGGVGIALPQDALAAATNPAGIVDVGDRLDVGLDYFMPRRGAEVTAPNPGANTFNGDGDKNFLVPEFGYNKKLGWDMAFGIAVYGNGGMNTKYSNNPGGFGAGTAGVDLVQVFVAPTFAMKVNKANSVGVSLVYAHQQFGAQGLQNFGVQNLGRDKSDGWGLRLGWTGQVSDNVTLGATYATKMRMSAFGKYNNLFAEQGDFDIPENYGIGIAVKATPKLTIAADVQQINYSNVKSIANNLDFTCFFAGTCPLGATNGPGFGWRDMTVYKLGVSYDYGKDLTLRAGFSTARQPIPNSQTYFNILAPGVIENHLTLGATWMMANKGELTVSYMHGFKNTVNGSGSIAAGLGGGEANIKMYQNSLGIAYGIKFD